MFCSKCGCQLPSIARFCSRCGSGTEVDNILPSVQASSSRPPEHSICLTCGHQYEPWHEHCIFCGQPIAPPALKTAEPRSTGSGAAAQRAPEVLLKYPAAASDAAPPYAQFVLFALLSEAMIAIVSFNIANDLERARWDSTISTGIAAILCVIFVFKAIGIWNKMATRGVTNEECVLHRKKLLARCIFFGFLFIGAGVTIGAVIGTSGAQTNEFLADSERGGQLVDKISQARTSAERTISGQIAMYKLIENDVQDWNLTLKKVREDLGILDQKYPSQHDSTQTVIRKIDNGLRRAALLQQQIAAAKEIEQLDTSEQWNAWQIRMKPLRDQEIALDQSR
jgi:hypothetical protein